MIRVYSVPNCPFCDELKGYLTQDNIEYIEIDVNDDKNSKEFQAIYNLTNCDDVPMVRIKNQVLIPNTSFTTIKQCFEIIKQLILD